MGLFSSLKDAAIEANEDAHGTRLLSEVHAAFADLEKLEPQLQLSSMADFLQILERVEESTPNLSRDGRIKLGRTMQRQARSEFDFNMAGSLAKWLAGAWLESQERTSLKATQAFALVQGFASYAREVMSSEVEDQPIPEREEDEVASITTYYDNLQVARHASQDVIKGAYQRLAQKYHPDKYAGDRAEGERIFKLINEAYSVLSDSLRRQHHDAWILEQESREFASQKQRSGDRAQRKEAATAARAEKAHREEADAAAREEKERREAAAARAEKARREEADAAARAARVEKALREVGSSNTATAAASPPTSLNQSKAASPRSSDVDYSGLIWGAVAVLFVVGILWNQATKRSSHAPSTVAPQYTTSAPSAAAPAAPSPPKVVDPDQARFDEIIARVERTHSQLNPASPLYRKVEVEIVIDRMKVHTTRGTPRSYALEMVIAEMERENALGKQRKQSSDGSALKAEADVKIGVPASQMQRTSKLAKRIESAPHASHPLEVSPKIDSTTTLPMKPLNAHWKFSGSRNTGVWGCDIGFRFANDMCEALPMLPGNAVYLAEGSDSWDCKSGYFLLDNKCISAGKR